MNYYEFVIAVEHFNYVIGMLLNAVLLYCIIFCNKRDLGKYRHLQIVIVIVDVASTTMQCFVRERLFSRNRMFAMVGIGIVDDLRALCLYAALFTLPFLLNDYSFLYRLWAVKYPHRIRHFSQLSFVSVLSISAALEGVTWFSVCYFLFIPSLSGRETLREEISAHYGLDSHTRAMFMAKSLLEDGSLNRQTLVGIAICVTIMGCCMIFMIYAISNIQSYLIAAKLTSKASIRLQQQLFLTLCLQTLIPFFALYLSCGAFHVLPLFDVDVGWTPDLAPLFVSCFLPLDALAVLITMTDYRRAIIRAVKWRKKYEAYIASFGKKMSVTAVQHFAIS